MDSIRWLREQAANDFTCETKLLEIADEIEQFLVERMILKDKIEQLQTRLYLNGINHNVETLNAK